MCQSRKINTAGSEETTSFTRPWQHWAERSKQLLRDLKTWNSSATLNQFTALWLTPETEKLNQFFFWPKDMHWFPPPKKPPKKTRNHTGYSLYKYWSYYTRVTIMRINYEKMSRTSWCLLELLALLLSPFPGLEEPPQSCKLAPPTDGWSVGTRDQGLRAHGGKPLYFLRCKGERKQNKTDLV